MAKRKARALTKTTRQTGTSNMARDRKRKAIAPGKRRSKSGRIYYEYRKNRSDVKGRDTPRTQKQVLKKYGVRMSTPKEMLKKMRNPKRKNPFKKDRTQSYLKGIIKKIKWVKLPSSNIPMSQGLALKKVIDTYKIPAKKVGYSGRYSQIGVETNKQFILWEDKGTHLNFLGLVDK